MNLHLYSNETDFFYLKSWTDNERVHALWCANLIPYPVTEQSMRSFLEKEAAEWGGEAYMVLDDAETPVGFFILSVNDRRSGFLKFVLLDNRFRGRGLGTKMISAVEKFAFEMKQVSELHLNVFDVNQGARKCYQKAGFQEESITEDVFAFQGERWGRCHMVIKTK